MQISILAKNEEDLPMLTEQYKGSSARIKRGIFTDLYAFLWMTPKDREPYGEWKKMASVVKK